MRSRKGIISIVAAGMLFVPTVLFADDATTTDTSGSSIYMGLGAGAYFREGDEALEDTTGQYEARVGYDFDNRWGGEFSVGLQPTINTNTDASHNPEVGQKHDDVFGVKTGVDALYHFNGDADRTWDPFSAIGGGLLIYDHAVGDGSVDVYGDIGGGLAYNIDNNWSLRGDYRMLVVGEDSQINHSVLGSVGYRWGGAGTSGSGAGEEGSGLNEEGPLKNVYFDFDKSNIKATEEQKLKENVQYLKQNPSDKVTVEGHCDERGTNEYNMALGERRASSVSKYYQRSGVDSKRVGTVSYGEERPADPGHNEAAWSKNRRAVSRVKQ